MIPPWLLLSSTTSHKREPLNATLEVFSRLGMLDLDLNLHHMIELGVSLDDVRAAVAAGGQHVWIVSGGWCDFYHGNPRIEETFRSVDRQVAMARRLGVDRIRLFFGRLRREDCSGEALATIAANLGRLSGQYPDMLFVFENHDGASLCPGICRSILEAVARPNIRMSFDPMNFEHAGINSMDALAELQPHIAHVHLKGLDGDQYCEFGSGSVDLVPLLRSLIGGGYGGAFTVEYEGTFDRTVRLYEGVQRARVVLKDLSRP
ncbi:MAG: hypothetical protein PVSMB1_06330 [Gemmatimonadaceae bacterium]